MGIGGEGRGEVVFSFVTVAGSSYLLAKQPLATGNVFSQRPHPPSAPSPAPAGEGLNPLPALRWRGEGTRATGG